MKKQILSLVLLATTFLMAFITIDSSKTDEICFSIKETDKSDAKITDSLYKKSNDEAKILTR